MKKKRVHAVYANKFSPGFYLVTVTKIHSEKCVCVCVCCSLSFYLKDLKSSRVSNVHKTLYNFIYTKRMSLSFRGLPQ